MKWLTNATDHRKEGHYINYDANDPTGEYRRQWLADKIIGRPKASDKYTVEQLESMGIIGIYAASAFPAHNFDGVSTDCRYYDETLGLCGLPREAHHG